VTASAATSIAATKSLSPRRRGRAETARRNLSLRDGDRAAAYHAEGQAPLLWDRCDLAPETLPGAHSSDAALSLPEGPSRVVDCGNVTH